MPVRNAVNLILAVRGLCPGKVVEIISAEFKAACTADTTSLGHEGP